MANYTELVNALTAVLGGSAGDLIAVTPTVYTAGTTAAGSVLFDFTAIPGSVTAAGRVSLLQDIIVADKADTGATITLVFANQSAALGTLGSAPTISDADSLKITGVVQIAAADWIDLGGCRVACIKNIGALMKPISTSSYVAGFITTGGTGGTFTAGDLQFSFGILQG